MIKTRTMIIAAVILFLVIIGVIHLGGFYFDRRDFGKGKVQIYGVSFRPAYAKYFGLDPNKTALAIFDELKAKHARVIIPWEEIEPTEGNFDFSFFDWFVKESEKRNVKLVVNIGERVPGWPEFHIPDWALKLSTDERKAKILNMLTTIVNRYKNSPAVEMWQIENEPLFNWRLLSDVEKIYGISLKPDPEFLKSEIDLVKKLDSHPIIITDSGELSDWKEAAQAGDYFGTTLYRFLWQRIYDGFGLRLYYGYLPPFTWISPAYYRNKAEKISLDINKVFIMELQAEPWIRNEFILSALPDLQFKIFGVKQFKSNVEYARKTGFPRAYLWGAEWWYYLKVNGYPQVWNEAKKLWQ